MDEIGRRGSDLVSNGELFLTWKFSGIRESPNAEPENQLSVARSLFLSLSPARARVRVLELIEKRKQFREQPWRIGRV